ncbi:MAG: hypothetical protein JJE47_13915 [Acidimicrobiia bacterium]|nr:hypothetical protein [Acidimicrobiia bacterium]
MERIDWCQQKGLSWFRHNVLVVGRRGSKNFCASIMVARLVWKLICYRDPQKHYQLPSGKPLRVLVVGPDLDSVKKNAFGDIVNLFRHAKSFQPYLGASTATMLSILTPAQLALGAQPGVDVGTIQIVAAATTATSGRGPAAIGIVFDEPAHVQGAGSTADSIAVFRQMTPAAGQFENDGLIIQISTPWEKVGQFYLSYCEGREVRPGDFKAAYPNTLMIQQASTGLYKDWERADQIPMWPGGPTYRGGLRPVITQEFVDEEYRRDPESADTEWGGQFRANRHPYLTVASIDRGFGPYQGVLLENKAHGYMHNRYVAHGDPSRSNANFGWAIGHVESDEFGHPHVVFDLLKAWLPGDYPNGVINYLEVNNEILEYITAFYLRVVTFDQYASAEPIQLLESRCRAAGMWWQPRIFERTATAAHNLRATEIFKTAWNAGLVHAPPHALARAELEHLTRHGDRIVAPTTGPVKTKDLADAMINVVYTLLHDRMDEVYAAFSGLQLRGSVQGGITPTPYVRDRGDPHQQLSNFGRDVRDRNLRSNNPARGLNRRRR